MRDDASLADWLRLTLIAGVGGQTQRKLLSAFGLPEAVFAAGHDAWRQVVGDKAAELLSAGADAQRVDAALTWAQGDDQHIVTLADAAYPRLLLEIPDPPTLLYVRGRVELLNQPALAIVGSRSPTAQGERDSERFAAALAQSGLTIASGLALGIDAAAHRGALSVGGDTVAFLGTGIDRVYPARNHELALAIGAHGAIVSELPIGTPVSAANFPRRNRLISGIARGVLVVEAALQSGSLITARLAAEQGRDVFALPGSIHAPQARGCHLLIKQGAKLVDCVQDVLEELGIAAGAAGSGVNRSSPSSAGDRLLTLMDYAPCGLDELAERSGIGADALAVELLRLELDGRVASLPGGRYQRLAAD